MNFFFPYVFWMGSRELRIGYEEEEEEEEEEEGRGRGLGN